MAIQNKCVPDEAIYGMDLHHVQLSGEVEK